MSDAETFGVEKGYGERVVEWINSESKMRKTNLEARLYGYDIITENFGTFDHNSNHKYRKFAESDGNFIWDCRRLLDYYKQDETVGYLCLTLYNF